jgi:hypothetical protein
MVRRRTWAAHLTSGTPTHNPDAQHTLLTDWSGACKLECAVGPLLMSQRTSVTRVSKALEINGTCRLLHRALIQRCDSVLHQAHQAMQLTSSWQQLKAGWWWWQCRTCRRLRQLHGRVAAGKRAAVHVQAAAEWPCQADDPDKAHGGQQLHQCL